jgi:hypothetical protein
MKHIVTPLLFTLSFRIVNFVLKLLIFCVKIKFLCICYMYVYSTFLLFHIVKKYYISTFDIVLEQILANQICFFYKQSYIMYHL